MVVGVWVKVCVGVGVEVSVLVGVVVGVWVKVCVGVKVIQFENPPLSTPSFYCTTICE